MHTETAIPANPSFGMMLNDALKAREEYRRGQHERKMQAEAAKFAAREREVELYFEGLKKLTASMLRDGRVPEFNKMPFSCMHRKWTGRYNLSIPVSCPEHPYHVSFVRFDEWARSCGMTAGTEPVYEGDGPRWGPDGHRITLEPLP